uniref:ATP-dependent CLP protease n=1 Tax=Pseudomonas phage Arace01 TaxID=3138526 RepID=A0AAU6VZU3_9VIRU
MTQLFKGRNQAAQVAPVNTAARITDVGNLIFPSQEKIYAQLRHVIGVFKESEAAIRPHFNLTGESGTGKSFLIKMVADEYKMPVIEVNAAGLTAEGLSGNSLSKALTKLREHWNEPNIIFVDEFDKLFQRNGEGAEGFRVNVQDEFLTALEGKYVSVFAEYGKYPQVVVENSLFIFAGAWSNQKILTLSELKDAGMRTEFVGRVPLIFHTNQVSLEELQAAIPSIDLFIKYRKMFPGTKQNRDVAGIIKILKEQSEEMNIGIRLLNSAIHQYYMRDV